MYMPYAVFTNYVHLMYLLYTIPYSAVVYYYSNNNSNHLLVVNSVQKSHCIWEGVVWEELTYIKAVGSPFTHVKDWKVGKIILLAGVPQVCW